MMEPLLDCVNSGLISKPVFPTLPEHFPLRIAISAAKLTDDCAPPPGGIGHRVGIGVSDTNESAALIAMMEATERYSLQYSTDSPEVFSPIRTLGGKAEPLGRDRIMLGSPATGYQVTTRGAASGPNLPFAVKHAAYECYEHYVRDHLSIAGGGAGIIEVSQIQALSQIAFYLTARLRRINLLMYPRQHGLVFIACICSDIDGGRPTTGFAAGEDLSQVAAKAAREAILQWRNMIELERNCISVEPLSDQDLEVVQIYRGVAPLQGWLRAVERMTVSNKTNAKPLEDPLEAVHNATGRRVRLFDVSNHRTRIPTVRVVLE